MVVIDTFNLATGKPEGPALTKPLTRQVSEWLVKHTLWCVNNGCGVQVRNVKDGGDIGA
jgi:hypothetical protein